MNMNSDQSDGVSWRPPQPSFTTSTNEVIVERLESQGDATHASPNLVLLTKLVRMIVAQNLIEFDFHSHRRELIGEGATYQVSRVTVHSFWEQFWGEAKEILAAVKIAKLNVGRTFNDIGTNEAERRRLKVVLFELDILARSDIREHPNIASLLGFSWDETAFGYAPCLVMELATMGTARDFTSSNRTLSDLEKKILCRDVACGLHFLHACGIVQGDVKQDNVLIYADNESPVGFVARISDLERCPQNSESMTYTGTTLYNAPEVQSPGHCPPAADTLWLCDVFSFGLLCFEVLADLTWKSVLETRDHTGRSPIENQNALELARASIEKNWHSSNALRHICQNLLTVTLAISPSERLPLGWGVALEILGNHKHTKISEPLEPVKTSSYQAQSFSILEIHSQVRGFFEDRLGNAMWFDLHHTATRATDDEQRGSAAFSLFILYSLGRYGPYKNIEEALDLLSISAVAQYGPAFIVGKRMFNATGFGHRLPSAIENGPQDPELSRTIALLEGLPNEDYYSAAVQAFWPPKLRLDALKLLPNLHDIFGGTTPGLLKIIPEQRQRMSIDDFQAYVQDHYLLHHSIVNSDLEACKLLLQFNCEINRRMPGGMTPLHLAFRCVETEMIKLLVQYGADASLTDNENISPLHWLVLLNKDDLREIAALLSSQNKYPKTIMASTKPKSPIYFDDLGLEARGTPLYWAIDCRNSAAIQAMIDFGFVPLLDKSWPQSYLNEAVGTACPESITIFLKLCRDQSTEAQQRTYKSVGLRGSDFNRWVMHGGYHDQVYGDVLDLLSQFGFKLPLKSSEMIEKDQWTPLCTAVSSYHLPLIKVLLQRGADVNDRSIHTALGWAFASADATGPKHKVTDVVSLLLEHGAITYPEPPLYQACSFFVDPAILGLLISQDPQSANALYHGQTPLLNLLSFDIKDDLLSKVHILTSVPGANLDAETPHTGRETECCYTALAYSLVNLEWPVARYLLDNNATYKIGINGDHQHTVLHLVIRHTLRIQGEKDVAAMVAILNILEKLLEHPVSMETNLINIKDHNGISPLRMAIDFMLPDAVKRLLKPKYGMDRAIVDEDQRWFLQNRTRVLNSDRDKFEKPMKKIEEIFSMYSRL